MKTKFVNKLVCMSMATVMICGSLAGCTSEEPEVQGEVEATEEVEATPELSKEELYPATVSPASIHPGTLNSTEQLDSTSDRWYPDGDTSSEHYFRLTQMTTEQSNIGLDIEYCKDQGDGYLYSGCALQGKDGHAVGESTLQISGEEETIDFDLTFQDAFTCYNWATDTVWKRCHPTAGAKDISWYDAAIAGNIAYVEFAGLSYERITFAEDHTFVSEHDDDPNQTYTGTWEVKATNLVWLHFDDPIAAGITQPVDITEEVGFEASDDGEDVLYDVVPQEFDIDENGKITAFGVYPTYDVDGNMGFSATYCFGTEEEIQAQLEERSAGAAGQPEDYNDLTADDLAGAPDFVVEQGDNDAASDLQVAMMSDDMAGKIVEIHGTVDVAGSSYSIIVPKEGSSTKTKFYLFIANKPSAEFLPQEGEEAVVKAIIWKINDNWELVTDENNFSAIQ